MAIRLGTLAGTAALAAAAWHGGAAAQPIQQPPGTSLQAMPPEMIQGMPPPPLPQGQGLDMRAAGRQDDRQAASATFAIRVKAASKDDAEATAKAVGDASRTLMSLVTAQCGVLRAATGMDCEMVHYTMSMNYQAGPGIATTPIPMPGNPLEARTAMPGQEQPWLATATAYYRLGPPPK